MVVDLAFKVIRTARKRDRDDDSHAADVRVQA